MKKAILVTTSLILASSFVFGADLVVKQKGKAAGKDTVMKESKVPQFPLVRNGQRVSNIPKLDVGSEPILKSGDIKPVTLPENKKFSAPQISERQSPRSFH